MSAKFMKLPDFLTKEEPLLVAYKEMVISLLQEELMAAAKPLIRKAAEEAVKPMEASIRSYLDTYGDRVVVKFEATINDQSAPK